MNTLNTFNNGMVLDLHPISTPATVLSNCLNGTLITKNGNEMILQNDVGNSKIIFNNKEVGLKKGYIPVGLKEFGGILYIFSVNPNSYNPVQVLDWEYDKNNPNHYIQNGLYYERYYLSEIGTFPSPDYTKTTGNLEYKYAPLNNFKDGEFNTWRLNFDIEHPLTIDCQKAYDGSINLIFTDNKNIPRLINSRFSLFGDGLYEIIDRRGERDTNLYEDNDDFEYATSLNKIVNKIIDIDFLGVLEQGDLPVGTYTFYFTLADSDDNESDFIGQSNIVTCHKGKLNDPKSIDGGVVSENSNKSVKFALRDIPKLFDRAYVYYSRNTCDETGTELTYYKKLVLPFKLDPTKNTNDIEINILGIESTQDVTREIINTNLANIRTAKGLAIAGNILFYSNINLSWALIDKIQDILSKDDTSSVIAKIKKEEIGNVSTSDYLDHSESLNLFEYYNVNNIYYRVGYWPGEYYRFGVVFILNDYQLSPTFDININFQNKLWKNGIILIPEELNNYGSDTNYAFGLTFTWNDSIYKELIKLGIKGYFFVRLKRLKNVICQGVKIGHDAGHSNLPLLYCDLFRIKESTKTSGYTEVTVKVSYTPNGAVTNTQDGEEGSNTSSSSQIVTSRKLTITYNGESKTYYDDDALEALYYMFPDKDRDLAFSDEQYTYKSYNYKDTDTKDVKTSDWFTQTFLKVSDAMKSSKDKKGSGLFDWMVKDKSITRSLDFNFFKNNFDLYNADSSKCIYDLGVNILTKNNARYWTNKKIAAINQKDKLFHDPNNEIKCNAAICPEFEVLLGYYRSLFTGNKFFTKSIYDNILKSESLINYCLTPSSKLNSPVIESKILAVPEECGAMKIDDLFFSSVAGNASEAYLTKLPFTDWTAMFDGKSKDEKIDGIKMDKGETNLAGLVRGIWGPYLGITYNGNSEDSSISVYTVFNIYANDYSKLSLEKQINLRKNDFSEYYPVTLRKDISNKDCDIFAGDCFVCNFAHRMNRNFMDPNFPISDDIADYHSFYKGFLYRTDTKLDFDVLNHDDVYIYIRHKSEKTNSVDAREFLNRTDVNAVPLGHWLNVKILSSINLSMRSTDGTHLSEKAITNKNRTFHPYSWLDTSSNNKTSDSYLFNSAYAKTLGELAYFLQREVPYNRTNYSNRIMYSDIAVKDAFINNFRTFRKNAFVDYTRLYGEIVKIMNYRGTYLFCVFEHAIGIIEVNERAVLLNSNTGLTYIDVNKVLSEKPNFISTEFGSQWADSVIQTPTGVYGVDTVAKKIWVYNTQVEVISDFTISKFLKDYLLIGELNTLPNLTSLNVKTHYNRAKLDVMFTFYKKDELDYIGWNVCYNEITKKWTTFYSWIPSYSGNINNVFYSFNNDVSLFNDESKPNLLWKHHKDNNWCKWYDELHPFEFEFIIAENPQIHKVLLNLHIIANKTKPESFHFEIVGEVYNFSNDKQNMYFRLEKTKELYSDSTNISYDNNYRLTDIKLNPISTIFPLYISRVDKKNKLYDIYLHMTSNSIDYEDMSGSEIVYDDTLNEYCIATHIKACPIDDYKFVPVCTSDETAQIKRLLKYYTSKGIETKLDDEYFYKKVSYGRRLGNCDYKENQWKVQIPSINYIQVNEDEWTEPPICLMTNPVPEEIINNKSELSVPKDTVCEYNVSTKQTKIRDKFIKVKVRYSGEDLAIISAILSMYKESYS